MEIKDIILESQKALAIRLNCSFAELGDKFGEIYSEIGKHLKENSIKTAGYPYGKYHSFSPEKIDLEAGIAVEGNAEPAGRIILTETYGGKAVMTVFTGHYDKLAEAWKKFAEVVDGSGYKLAGPCFEVYVTDPAKEPDSSKWITELYTPVQ